MPGPEHALAETCLNELCMSKRSIGTTLTMAFTVLIGLLVCIGWLSLKRMNELNQGLQDIALDHWVEMRLATDAMQYSNENSRLVLQVFLVSGRQEIDTLVARRKENSAKISAVLEDLRSRVEDDTEAHLLTVIEQKRAPYLASYTRALHVLLDDGDAERAKAVMLKETLPLLLQYRAAWADYVQFQREEMDRTVAQGALRYTATRRMALYLVVAAILVSICIAFFMTRKMTMEVSRRAAAEHKALQLNESLERKVVERTNALEQSNEALTNEIIERRRAEEQLRLLSSAVEQSPVSVVITDPHGCITYVNREYTVCTGYSPEEVIGNESGLLKPGQTTPEEYKDLWTTISRGQEWRGEIRNHRKNGEVFWEAVRVRPIRDARGDISHFLAVKEDITERKLLEGQLQQAQKLEAIGQLAAGIAHEINTPIQYVGDNTAFVKDSWTTIGPVLAAVREISTCPEGEGSVSIAVAERELYRHAANLEYLEKEIPCALDQSLQGVQRVARIVQAMREFSHPGMEEKAAIDLNRAIESTIEVARNEWKYVAQIETHFAKDLPPVTCYVGELNQVILNLITNSAYAIAEVVGDGSKSKGTITISTRRDGAWAEIALADTGRGIPEAARSRVFEPFFTTKPVGKGTGQGLALAHNTIVKKHDGEIRFETRMGKGTTFFVRLPIGPRTHV